MPPLRVQHLRVDHACPAAGRRRWRRSRTAPPRRPCPTSRNLAKEAGSNSADPLAAGAVLLADRLEPVRPAEAVDVARLVAPGPGEPVRPLPAELLAEHGAGVLQPLVERRAAQRPAAIDAPRPARRSCSACRRARACASRTQPSSPCGRPKRRMSTGHRSIGGSPAAIHSASARPAPPAEAMPKALKPPPT